VFAFKILRQAFSEVFRTAMFVSKVGGDLGAGDRKTTPTTRVTTDQDVFLWVSI
jgi:hypothetical protein